MNSSLQLEKAFKIGKSEPEKVNQEDVKVLEVAVEEHHEKPINSDINPKHQGEEAPARLQMGNTWLVQRITKENVPGKNSARNGRKPQKH